MNGLRGRVITIILLHVITACLHAQNSFDIPLFQNKQPLSIRLNISLGELKKNKSDSTYFPIVLHFKGQGGIWDSIPITIRARGNFRRKHCYFPPLRIKIKKGDAKETLFAGTKSLKLVLPCQPAKGGSDLILKEYLCYQLAEPTTPYVFNTRLLDIELNDVSGKHRKTHQLKGFFIEDDDAVARRFQAKVIDAVKLHPLLLQDTNSIRLDLFQYMIGNTDFSTTFFHNMKVILTKAGYYIPIAYDFDMAGLVNAPYATFDESLGISSVRDRVYKGFCRNEKVAEFVHSEFISLEQKVSNVLDLHESYFDPKEFAGIKKYIDDFFTIIKNDKYYTENIVNRCRTR